VGAEHWKSVDQACDSVIRVASRVEPYKSSSDLMQRNYRTYQRIYPALGSIGRP